MNTTIIQLIDSFIEKLNEEIVNVKKAYHNYYDRAGEVNFQSSIVLINESIRFKNKHKKIAPLVYLIEKYCFQNSSYGFFIGQDELSKNKFLPVWRFGYSEDQIFSYCYNIETDEVILIFEETNEIMDYCAPNLEIFFQMLIEMLPHISSYEAMLKEKNGTYSRDERVIIANQLISKFNLDSKYHHFVIHTIAGEDF